MCSTMKLLRVQYPNFTLKKKKEMMMSSATGNTKKLEYVG